VALLIGEALDEVFSGRWRGAVELRAVNGGVLADGQTFTIDDDTTLMTFEFDNDGNVTPGNTPVPFVDTDSATDVATSIVEAINALDPAMNLTATSALDFITLNGETVTFDQGTTNLIQLAANPRTRFTSCKVDGELIHMIGHNFLGSIPQPYSNILPYSNFLPADQPGGTFLSNARGQDNLHEGFYIDDLLIGFTERGEMITDATPQFDFTPVGAGDSIVTGEYQLEIRRGSEYGMNWEDITLPMPLIRAWDTNDRHAGDITLKAPERGTITHGETFVISDGVTAVTFQFLDAELDPPGGQIIGEAIYIDGSETAGVGISDLIVEAINKADFNVTAASQNTALRVDLFDAAWVTGIDYIVFGDVNTAEQTVLFPQDVVEITEVTDKNAGMESVMAT